MAADVSECPGCRPNPRSGHFFRPRKRRRGLPRRKAGQGRWPGQVALVSRVPAAILAAAHPTEPGHPLPSGNQTPWPGETSMRALIGGLRAMATGGRLFPARQPGPPCSPSGQELRRQRDRDLDKRGLPNRQEGLVLGTHQRKLENEQLRCLGLGGGSELTGLCGACCSWEPPGPGAVSP